ncbi:hypothetical protein [Pseudonocardia parietis]|uniref:LppX_LprAFG lipoprotein n=1 Tax=Pseudonocardia parietis TaxID=570936 RepID=A0ABS4W3G8_9PSEU|nr:hypothetical protein [Pseudonocardia parietis]MBP2370714.1 hypothetical protein [Pseudonocardia parietis]
MRRAASTVLATVFATVLALVLAGCTGADAPSGDAAAPAPPPDPREVVAGAGQALADAGSARLRVALDLPTGRVEASGPARFAPFAADLTVALGTRGAQVRVVGDDAWIRLGGADRWQRLSTGMLPVGAVTGALHTAPGLRDVTEQPGREDVGGVPALRYTGTVDLAAARTAAPDPATATRIDELAGLVSPTPRFTAWLGAPDAAGPDRGRLVRLRLEPAAPGTGTPAAGPITLDVAEPGLPVEVTAP